MAQKNTPLEKQVRNAIHKLNERGQQITNQAVREAIGGGSFRDLGPLVKTVKAELAAQEHAARAAPEMPEDFHDAAAAMWQTAWELSDEIAASERRAHAGEIVKLKAEVAEALSNCGQVESERDEADARVQAVAELLEKTKGALQEALLENARLSGRLMERETDIVSRIKQPKMHCQPALPGHERPAYTVQNHDAMQPDMFLRYETRKKMPVDPEATTVEKS